MGRQPTRFYKKPSLWLAIGLITMTVLFVPPFFLTQQSYLIIDFSPTTYSIEAIPEIDNLTVYNVRIRPIIYGTLPPSTTDLSSLEMTIDDIGSFVGSPSLTLVKQRNIGVIKISGNGYVLGVEIMIEYTNNFSNRITTAFTKYFIDPNEYQNTSKTVFDGYFLPMGFTMTIGIVDLFGTYSSDRINASTTGLSAVTSISWNPFHMFDTALL